MKRLLGIILVVLVEIIYLGLFKNNFSELILNPKSVLLSNLPQPAVSIVGLCLPPTVGLCLPGIAGRMFTTLSCGGGVKWGLKRARMR